MMLSVERKEILETLATRMGVKIKDFALFDQALTHASTAADIGGTSANYESLEFLGDAVLGLATAHYLFNAFPGKTPGEYSKMRAGLVSRRTLARIARNLDISSAIRLGRGEEMAGGRQRMALLADCLESFIGAVYLDSGLKAAQKLVENIFQEEFSRADLSNRFWDYKSDLQIYCQGLHNPLPVFRVTHESGPDHRKVFEVEVLLEGVSLGKGCGSSKKEAEQIAAREALDRVKQQIG